MTDEHQALGTPTATQPRWLQPKAERQPRWWDHRANQAKLGGAILVVAVLAIAGWSSGRPSAIESAAATCSAASNVQDDGSAISFDTKGDEDLGGDTITEVVCVLSALDIPQHIISHMDSTRALDGQQTDDWKGFTARWSYHPNTGMRLTVVAE